MLCGFDDFYVCGSCRSCWRPKACTRHLQVLWSGLRNSRFLGLCCHPTCLARAIPQWKKFAPIDDRVFPQYDTSHLSNFCPPFGFRGRDYCGHDVPEAHHSRLALRRGFSHRKTSSPILATLSPSCLRSTSLFLQWAISTSLLQTT